MLFSRSNSIEKAQSIIFDSRVSDVELYCALLVFLGRGCVEEGDLDDLALDLNGRKGTGETGHN